MRISHASDPQVRRGLKHAYGHLASILPMLDENRSCLELAQQLQAVESTIRTVKRALIHDHMEHCLADAVGDGAMTTEQALREFKALTKYL
ncbi:metal-sensing transcriptional repressor [Sphingomonas oligophenolica]|uniref:metal-sensing transcriptional repressor n=1 Tax=Sphingomonas oligophenolica TaxID=301154 RepID=UPI00112C84BE|nr:metal-sensing transcriptional repressor [Sphingomonas oligophenolica]